MPRKITVATVSLRGGSPPTVEANLAAAERRLAHAAAVRPDIVCLPEVFSLLGIPAQDWPKAAEPVPGPTTERIGAVARRFGMYVVCPVMERQGDRVLNAGVLLDRQGQVAGVYHKVHPTLHEMEVGVTPGTCTRVFTTDFGKVAILICFDAMFPARWQEAKSLGAEIVFWASAYEGGLPLQARACDYEYYVVAATPLRYCQILDITGYPLASTGYYTDVAWARLDLEKRLFSTDCNMAQYPAIVAKYGQRVTFNVLSPEGAFTLESNDPALTVADIVREFGLEAQQDYFARSTARQDAARRAPAGRPGCAAP
ncbi:MAG: carbon-nitrogen hydrolase family protein [Planctomycetes bacterium]|nr:carbon-nitrogen hydrolase family protein [Planctomycetota bacterium]